MLPVVTADEMRALDKATIEEIGIPGFALMENAGRGVAETAMAMLLAADVPTPELPATAGLGWTGLANAMVAGRSVAVVCGPGNNGGDGFAIARVLRSRGVDAIAYLAVARTVVKGDALAHLHVLERSGGVLLSIATPPELDRYRDAIAGADLVVDALFGIGLVRAVEGHLAQVIETINRAPLRLAVDIPSGLETDTGKTLGIAVEAHQTATMAALKIALVGSPGFASCGELSIVDIGVPPALARSMSAGLVERADVARWLPQPSVLDHKGKRGHVLVVGGKLEMRGAGRLAAMAALRAGAGLVTLTANEPPVDLVVGDPADSIMTRLIETPGHLSLALDGKDAVVIGPGLGTGDHALALVDAVLHAGVPAVLDADALNLIAGQSPDAARLAAAAGPIAITPHPAEAARLLGCTTADVEADRLAAACKLAALTRAVVVLKGARTVVCDGTLGDTFCSINPTGGPALGTAGSGDVLAGALGALLGQGCPTVDAARAAVYVHGLAGDELARTYGDRGVISSDLPSAIAHAVRDLSQSP